MPTATSPPLRLVHVEDADGYAALIGAMMAADPAPPEYVRFGRLDAALAHLAEDGPDCVVLDLGLPDADGVEALERVLAVRPDVPVVVLTADEDAALPARLIRAGAQDCVPKGAEPELMRSIRAAVERRRGDERRAVERTVRDVSAEPRAAGRGPSPGPRVALAVVGGALAAVLAVVAGAGAAVPWAIAALVVLLAARASRATEEDARLLHAIVDGAGDAIFVKDLEGRYILANAAQAALHGHPRDFFLGRTDFEVTDPVNAAAWREGDRDVLASGRPRRTWRTSTIRGVERTLSTVKVPHRDRAGRTVGVIGISRDETAMRRLEEESSRFFDVAPDLLCTLRSDGTLERANPAWTAALGWTADELRARPLRDFVHPEDRRAAPDDPARLDGVVHRLATRAGGWRDVAWTARAVPEHGRIYAVARDVTDRRALAGALASSDARYRALAESLPHSSVVCFDHDLRFTFAAGEALAAAGLDGDNVGRTLAEVLPQHAAALTPRYRAVLGGHAQSFEFAGAHRHYWVQAIPLREGDGAIAGGMLISQDITALKTAERGLAAAESRFRTAFEQAPIGMALVDLRGRFLRVNPALCAIAGRTADELLRTTPAAIAHPDDASAAAVTGEDARTRETRFVRPDGEVVWVALHVTVVRDADGSPQHLLAQIVDVTDRHRTEAQLQRLADHDALTDLFNRRRFEQDVRRHAAESARYGPAGALLLLDLDGFKVVNDTHGHQAGDELLAAVGTLLRRQLRESDVIGRLGGDEFAVLLPAGGRADATAVAAKLVAAVRDELGMTASVGVAAFTDGLTAAEALARADLAMYAAKRAGRDGHAVHGS